MTESKEEREMRKKDHYKKWGVPHSFGRYDSRDHFFEECSDFPIDLDGYEAMHTYFHGISGYLRHQAEKGRMTPEELERFIGLLSYMQAIAEFFADNARQLYATQFRKESTRDSPDEKETTK